MIMQENDKPEIFRRIANIFNVTNRIHTETLEMVKNSILEGSSKWSAKIYLTGFLQNLIGALMLKETINY